MDYICSSEHPQLETAPKLLSLLHNGEEHLFHVLYINVDTPREGREACGASQSHAHDVYHLVIYNEGENAMALNGEVLPYSPGALVAVSPGEPHTLTPCMPGKVKYHEITFALYSPSGWLRLPLHSLLSAYFGVELRPRCFPIQLTERIADSFRLLIEGAAEALTSNSPDRLASGSRLVTELLSALMKSIYLDAPGSDAASSGLASAKELLDSHFREPLRLDELAEVAALSSDHFCRAFKKRYGISPISYQIELKIQAAKMLLKNDTLNCKQIAELVGFRDEFYFSRIFKRRVGASPTSFRDGAGK